MSHTSASPYFEDNGAGHCWHCDKPKSDHPTARQVFSWDTGEGHLFEVVREPKNNVSRDGYEWVAAGTIARFSGPLAAHLLTVSVEALKYKGWAWVEPK